MKSKLACYVRVQFAVTSCLCSWIYMNAINGHLGLIVIVESHLFQVRKVMIWSWLLFM